MKSQRIGFDCFTLLAIAFDVKQRDKSLDDNTGHGFVLVLHHSEPEMLRKIAPTFLALKETDLKFVERFKLKGENGEHEYFVIIKIKVPRGQTVGAPQMK